jgi:serine O-acetyltransferase
MNICSADEYFPDVSDYEMNSFSILDPLFWYRVARRFRTWRIPFLPKFIDRLSVLVFRCYVPSTAEVGAGSRLGYWGIGIVIHERAKIGRNVFISHGVTVGGRSEIYEVPVIEDNAYIGAGAKVLGNVVVGEGSVVGANAVVISSIPSRCIAAGVPARIIRLDIDVREYTGWPIRPHETRRNEVENVTQAGRLL